MTCKEKVLQHYPNARVYYDTFEWSAERAINKTERDYQQNCRYLVIDVESSKTNVIHDHSSRVNDYGVLICSTWARSETAAWRLAFQTIKNRCLKALEE